MKRIVKKKYKMVQSYDIMSTMAWGGGSGLGARQKKLFYVCECGKTVRSTMWKKHKCKGGPDVRLE